MANGRPAGCEKPRTEISRGKLKVSYPISHRYSMSSNPSFESDLPEALDRSLSSFPEVKSLKAEQRLVIEKVVHGRDVFAQLPTGFGKSLTFQILPPLCKRLKSMGHNFPSKALFSCDRFSTLINNGRPGEVAEVTGFCSSIYWRKQ